MLKRQAKRDTDQVVVTFVLSEGDPRLPASVVGDFSGWDPAAHPLRRRSNGKWSASATVPRGRRIRFRYRGADGTWFNDDLADSYAPNDFGSTDCILEV